MLNSILFIVAFALGSLYTIYRMKKSLQMLQLNSYRNKRFLRWNVSNLSKIFSIKQWIPIVLFLSLYFFIESLAYIAWSVAYLMLILSEPKGEEKKPLVLTFRVKRLITTAFILGMIVLIVCLNVPNVFAILILYFFSLFTFLIITLANLLNSPIELWIKQRFLNDARRIILNANDLLVIGITGSFGKTSVKHFLNTVLKQQFRVLMTPESYNTPMGITKTIREMLRPTHEIFISEMGAKQKGDIKQLCDLAIPKYGIITAVGEQHLETFISLDRIKQTKFELAQSLPEDGVLFVNIDDDNISSYLSQLHLKCKVVKYGIHSADADFKAGDIEFSSAGTRFNVTLDNGEQVSCETKLLGIHNITNIVACVAVATKLGVAPEKMVQFIKKIDPVEHRLELKKLSNQISIIDDSFNSNPVGASAALDLLGVMEGKRVLITPGMIELGEKEYEYNKQLGVDAAKVCDYIVLVGEKQTKPIQDGLMEANYPQQNIHIANSFNAAFNHVKGLSSDHMIVLIENDLPDNYNE